MEDEKEPDGSTLLDPDERQGLKFSHVTNRGQLNQLEQTNIQNGLAWLNKRHSIDVLTEQFTKELHRRLLGEVWRWAGKFRQTEKNIGVDPVEIATQLRVLLDDARFWVEHETYVPLEAAARLHHRLVQIHCFPNGNGRHARIVADLYLSKHFDHAPIDWAAGHDLTNTNERRDTYIAALRNADGGDYSKFLIFVGAS